MQIQHIWKNIAIYIVNIYLYYIKKYCDIDITCPRKFVSYIDIDAIFSDILCSDINNNFDISSRGWKYYIILYFTTLTASKEAVSEDFQDGFGSQVRLIYLPR